LNNLPKLIIIGSVPPPYHGVTIYTEQLLLSNLNESLQIMHIDTSDHRGSDNYNKLDYQNVKIALKNVLLLIIALFRFKPDIIYCAPSPYRLPFLRESSFILLAKVFSKAKIIAHMHAGKFFKENFFKNSNLIMKSIIKNSLGMCDCGIVLGNNLLRYYESFFKNTVFLWNGINIEKKESFKLNKPKKGKLTIGYLSNLCENKGIITFMKTINNIPSEIMDKVKIVIAGDWLGGEDKTKNIFYELIDKNKFSNNISIIGGIYSFEQKRKFYLDLDIFVFPTQMEAFGLVNLEAMYFGCAVISTYEGAIPEVVINGETGYLVNKNDSVDLSNKLLKLIKSPQTIIDFAKAGRRRVLDNFMLKQNIDGLKNIFDNVLKN